MTGIHGNEFARRARAQTELLEIDIRKKAGELMLATDVEAEWARVMKIIAMGLETLPDLLERDCNLPAAAIERVEQEIDKLRENMAQSIAGEKSKAGA